LTTIATLSAALIRIASGACGGVSFISQLPH
jgi:hypothetical protein